jgi:hypothetical protein
MLAQPTSLLLTSTHPTSTHPCPGPAPAGPIPGAIFNQPYLRELDLSHNKLSGNLGAAGAALEGNSVNYLTFVELSNNELSGDLPASLARMALFDATRGDLLGSDLLPLPRVFSIYNNQFTGPFPTYVLDTFPRLVQFCSEIMCNATVAIAGENMKLSCPSPNDISTNITGLQPYELECIKGDGSRVDVVTYLLAAGVGTTNTRDAAYSGSTMGSAPGSAVSRGASSGSAMAPGSIAGLVIGLLVGIALLASVAYFVGYKRYYTEHRAKSFERMDGDTGMMSTEMVKPPEAGGTQDSAAASHDPALARGRPDESV